MARIKTSSQPLVGVVVDSASVYGRDVLRGVLKYANLQRRWVLHEDLWRATESLRRFPRCDGAIIAGANRATIDLIAERCRYVIHCSGTVGRDQGASVALDDEAAGRMAAEHLLNCRLEKFAFYPEISGPGVASVRFRSFREALEARGFPCDLSPVHWPSGVEWLNHVHRPQLTDWLAQLPKPIGIMAADDSAAHDLAGTCLAARIPVPDQVAIVGVNNDELLCEGSWPPLSSIDADYSRMGFAAARLLDRLLAGERVPAEDQYVRLPPLGVVQRTSTSVLAVDDPDLAQAVRYIRDHACDPCNVQDVLRHVPVARRRLERQFVSQLGRSPFDEIQRVRVESSLRLLLESDFPLAEIALRCGFAAVQNFNKTFRARMGVTPAVYRRQARGRSARQD